MIAVYVHQYLFEQGYAVAAMAFANQAKDLIETANLLPPSGLYIYIYIIIQYMRI